MKTEAILNLGFFSGLDNALKQYKKCIQSGLKKGGIDITLDQWNVLDIIVNNKDIKQTEIAKKANKDTASITRIIELLNRKGYVARQTDPNNRRRLVLGISNHGEKEYIRAGEIISGLTGKALSGLKEKRMKKLKKVFKNITKNCG